LRVSSEKKVHLQRTEELKKAAHQTVNLANSEKTQMERHYWSRGILGEDKKRRNKSKTTGKPKERLPVPQRSHTEMGRGEVPGVESKRVAQNNLVAEGGDPVTKKGGTGGISAPCAKACWSGPRCVSARPGKIKKKRRRGTERWNAMPVLYARTKKRSGWRKPKYGPNSKLISG